MTLTDQEREDVEMELRDVRRLYDLSGVPPLDAVGERRVARSLLLHEISRLERILEDND